MYKASLNISQRLARYLPLRLQPNLEHLTDNERALFPLLRQAAGLMDEPYWHQEYGDSAELLPAIAGDETRQYVALNYGPWDRMFGNEPILEGIGPKPAGANFYPSDMTDDEFERAANKDPALKGPYTMVRRRADGGVQAIAYSAYFRNSFESAGELLRGAGAIAESQAFSRFLSLRAEALLTDDYRASDHAWLRVDDSSLDLLIGPTEIEDRRFGLKTACNGSIFVTRPESTQRLARFKSHIPALQASLPPPAAPTPAAAQAGDLRVYDMAYAAGLDRRSTPTGIAWPDDDEVRAAGGTRSIVVDNLLRAKFDGLLRPLAERLISTDQLPYVRAEARIHFVLLHEMAHGLGVQDAPIDGSPVAGGLSDLGHPIEEAKANLAALWSARY